jgi:lipopolysaccharide assembly outer membrane protein LptD (OstA)
MWPHEWTARTNYSFNRSMFIDALIQYDPSSDRFNSNVRFNLIQQRVTTGDGTPPGRSLTLKATYMLSL